MRGEAKARSGCDEATAPGKGGTVVTVADEAREGACLEAGSVRAGEAGEAMVEEAEESPVPEGGTVRHPVGVGV